MGDKAGNDIRILLAMIDWLCEASGENLDPEDAAMYAQIKADYPAPTERARGECKHEHVTFYPDGVTPMQCLDCMVLNPSPPTETAPMGEKAFSSTVPAGQLPEQERPLSMGLKGSPSPQGIDVEEIVGHLRDCADALASEGAKFSPGVMQDAASLIERQAAELREKDAKRECCEELLRQSDQLAAESQAEIERLREALERIAGCVGTSTEAYKIARAALIERDENGYILGTREAILKDDLK